MEADAPRRILVVDDDRILRTALRTLLDVQRDMRVAGEAENAAEAFQQARAISPEIVLLDLTIPGTSGTTLIRELKAAAPRAILIVLTAHEDEQTERDVLDAGADAYIRKTSPPTDLLRAIRTAGAALEDAGGGNGAPPLSPAELEVLRRFALGYPMAQIASALGLPLSAVELYKRHGLRKLGLTTRAEVASFAIAAKW